MTDTRDLRDRRDDRDRALEAAAREIESITSPLFADEILAIMRRHGLRGPEATCPHLHVDVISDDHPSISRVIRSYVIGLNNAWNDVDRQRLLPYAARILCTATGEADEETRAWMAMDWLARVYTPAFLRLAGLEEHARALESLARIADATTARAAQPTLNAARNAAVDAAGGAAWDVAWAAAGDAVRAAAGDAVRAAAGDASRDASRDAARAAAWDAARVAAWVAAGDELSSTVEAFQTSALELLDAMIGVGARGDTT